MDQKYDENSQSAGRGDEKTCEQLSFGISSYECALVQFWEVSHPVEEQSAWCKS